MKNISEVHAPRLDQTNGHHPAGVNGTVTDVTDVTPEEYQNARYSLSEALSGTSFILAEAGSPPSRDFIDGLIGAANNRAGWFECPDAELIRYMWTDRDVTAGAKKKRLATQRRELMAWQSEPENPTIIECRPGGQIRDLVTGNVSNYPTRYKVTVLPLINQTLDEAKADPYYKPADPGPARSRAAARVWKREAPQLGGTPKQERRRRPPPSDAHLAKTILGYARRYVGKSEDQWQRLQQLHRMLDDAFIEEEPPPDFDPTPTLEFPAIIDNSEVDRGGGLILGTPPQTPENGTQNGHLAVAPAAGGVSENGYVSLACIPKFEPLPAVTLGPLEGEHPAAPSPPLSGPASLCIPKMLSDPDPPDPEPDDLPWGLPDPDPDHIPDYPDPIAVPSPDPDPEVKPDPKVAGLTPEQQAILSAYVWTTRGYKKFFYRNVDAANKTAGIHRHGMTYGAAMALAEFAPWLAEADEGHLSFMPRPLFRSKRGDMTLEELRADDAEQRPRAIHLDDLNAATFTQIRQWTHWGFESSPQRYQSVIFVTCDRSTVDVLRRRLVKGVGADPGANGSFRWPGSKNWKPKHGGCDVTLLIATNDRSWTPADLEFSALLAPPEPPPPPLPPVPPIDPSTSRGERIWKFPDHQRCIDSAPRKDDGITPNYSKADLAWCNICRLRGIPYEATFNELWRLREALDGKPTKHPDKGDHPGYVRLTVNKAYGKK